MIGMKSRIYVLTFLTYASVHMMRMTYSFNKHNLQKKFGIGDLFLGFLDALMFITLSLGTFFRYSILNDGKATLICLKTAIPTCLAFSFVPIASLFKGQVEQTVPTFQSYAILLIGIGLFGFCQFSFFPALITIFSHHFNVKSEGSLVGFWSSKSNAGNIIGFFFANFLVYQLHAKWQITMLIASIFHISVSLLLQRLVQDVSDDKENITTAQLIRFTKNKWKSLQFRLYILSFSFFKAILYSYELWTPQFLVDMGFKEYSGYVPMVFDISTVLGSYLMGKLYEEDQPLQGSRKIWNSLKSYKFFIASFFILISALMYLMAPPSIVMYFCLAVFMGLFLGGVYNSLQNNEILSYTKNNPRETDLLSTVNIGLGCFLVGIFQLIIGCVIYFSSSQSRENGSKQRHNHSRIYVVIAFLAVIAMILTFFKTYYSHRQKSDFQEVEINEINNTFSNK